jgi:hypothetical protein
LETRRNSAGGGLQTTQNEQETVTNPLRRAHINCADLRSYIPIIALLAFGYAGEKAGEVTDTEVAARAGCTAANGPAPAAGLMFIFLFGLFAMLVGLRRRKVELS